MGVSSPAETLGAELATAFERVEAFLEVQTGSDPDDYAAAVRCLLEVVGLDGDALAEIREGLERLEQLNPRTGDFTLGVVVGLLAAGEHG